MFYLLGVKTSVDIPVLVGSGVTKSNVHEYKGADGFIIGSHFKKNGRYIILYHYSKHFHIKQMFDYRWQNELDENVILEFMNCIKSDWNK